MTREGGPRITEEEGFEQFKRGLSDKTLEELEIDMDSTAGRIGLGDYAEAIAGEIAKRKEKIRIKERGGRR